MPVRGKLRHFGMNINGDCLFCYKVEETIGHISITCDLAINVWCTTENYCQTPININQSIIDWIEYLERRKTWYRKPFSQCLRENSHYFMGYLDP